MREWPQLLQVRVSKIYIYMGRYSKEEKEMERYKMFYMQGYWGGLRWGWGFVLLFPCFFGLFNVEITKE